MSFEKLMVIVVLFLAMIFSFSIYTEKNKHEYKMIEKGLQQCVVQKGKATHIVWQKECKND